MSGAAMQATTAVESGAYVNDVRYARLLTLWKQATGPQLAGTVPADGEVAQLLFREARLLDERLYDEWLAQYTAQCMVWVPAQPDPVDPRLATGIYLDDRRRMGDRIAMMRSGHLHAQTPPSRTRRMLTNAEQWVDVQADCIVARANLVIWEHRKGQTRAWPGYQVVEVTRSTAGSMLIANKIICFLERDAPQGNYAFIL
jgi:benzoate/toluate 1,2-dioxygenase subunit beta